MAAATKRHIKIELCVILSVCDYSMVVTLHKIGELFFRLRGANGFQAENERLTAAGSCCRQDRQDLKNENFTTLFGRLRQQIAPKSVRHVQHDYFF